MAKGSNRVSEGTGGKIGNGEGCSKRSGCQKYWSENFDPYRDRDVKAPCLGCEDRSGGCHSLCEKYLTYKKDYQAAKDRIHKENLGKTEASRARSEHMAEQQRRMRRGRAKEKQWTSRRD